MAKTTSITADPPNNAEKLRAIIAKVGIIAFPKACLNKIVGVETPFAYAVLI